MANLILIITTSTVQTLNETRYIFITKYPEFYPLEPEEEEAGWHFCPEFGYKLVGPGTPEQDMCECFKVLHGVKKCL